MDPADWQRALRRQFGRQQAFTLRNLGSAPVFSDFEVHNSVSQGVYRVAIRGAEPGSSTCTCPDYASNQLGTCKHIEFTLGQLLQQRGTKAALQRGGVPAHSALWLHQGPQRSVRFRGGEGCPPAVLQLAAGLFDLANGGALPGSRVDALQAFITSASTLCAATRQRRLWPVLLRDEAVLRARLHDLFLDLVVDTEHQVASAIEKAKKLNLLRQLGGAEQRFEVSPTLKLLFPAEQIQTLAHTYRALADGSAKAAPLVADDDDDDPPETDA